MTTNTVFQHVQLLSVTQAAVEECYVCYRVEPSRLPASAPTSQTQAVALAKSGRKVVAHKHLESTDIGIGDANAAAPSSEVLAEDDGESIDSTISEGHACAQQEASTEDVAMCGFDDVAEVARATIDSGVQVSAETQVMTGSAYQSESPPDIIHAPPHQPHEAASPSTSSIADRVMFQR